MTQLKLAFWYVVFFVGFIVGAHIVSWITGQTVIKVEVVALIAAVNSLLFRLASLESKVRELLREREQNCPQRRASEVERY